MLQSFHLFIRRHANDWHTASVLTHPQYAVYGPKPGPLREELREALADALSAGELADASRPTFFESLTQRALYLDLRAVQHDRLITVPMRFTMLVRPLEDDDHFEVMLPRLGQRFAIYGEDNIAPWSEELVRGFFHMSGVERLLDYQYERGARIERLDVTWHGARKLKKIKGLQLKEREAVRWQTPLSEVGVELTEEARQGRLDKAHFRDGLVDELIGVLSGQQNRSLLLVGPSGVGKTALVHEVAQRIAQQRVPPTLSEVPLWHVSGGRIIAGMKYLGQWQERCQAIVEEIRAERGILYVDSLLELMLSGSSQTGLNVASFLLPAIRSGELTVVAEATPDAQIMAEQIGAAFVHALRRVPVPSFSTERAYAILDLHSRKLAKTHKLQFSPASLSRALDVLARFGDADALPGSGLSLIEQMARVAPPPSPGRGGERAALTPQDAVAAFSRVSGFPQGLIDPDQLLDVEGVEGFFRGKVIGQPHATALLTNLVVLVKASLNDPQKPLGSFLFMGPTGVGKTESALSLAEYLFGDRERLVRLDMSEYAWPGSAIRLVGDGRGEGELTRKIREQPFCVLLFDEIEKADPEVFDVLLQVLGEGRLTDGTGRTARFTHAIIIMTSNLGADRKAPIRFADARQERRDLGAHYTDAAARFFKPEFINRVDFVVPFDDLGADSVRRIAGKMLDSALGREGFARRGIEVRYEEAMLDLLMERGFDPRYGARPMKRAVEQHVLIPLSRRLVRRRDDPEQRPERFDLYVDGGRAEVVSSRGVGGAPAPVFVGPALWHEALWRRALHQIRLRLQEWAESQLIRSMIERGDRAAVAESEAILLELQILERAAPAGLGGLEEATRTAAQAACAAINRRLGALERALCLAGLGGEPRARLVIEPGALHPEALRLSRGLTEQLRAWIEAQGLAVEVGGDEDGWVLSAVGEGAEALLREEVGVHRFRLAGEADLPPVDVLARAEGVEAAGVVREIHLDPPTIWDPVTEIELPDGLDRLSEHLDRLVLARMCARLSRARI